MVASISKTTFAALGRIPTTVASSVHHKSLAWAKAAPVTRSGVSLSLKTTFTSPSLSKTVTKRFYATGPTLVGDEKTNVFSPPDITEYRAPVDPEDGNRTFAYLMVGSLSMMSAVGAKAVISDYLVHFAASADVVALAKVEINMNSIPEGKNVIVKWRGKPIFVRHRTADEIAEARAVSVSDLRHQETDDDRTKRPEWLVMLGVCTHLGCVPIGEAGEYGGWFCPCHGSHYDISGRIRKGPAPWNLEIPEYEFTEDEKIIIG